MGYRTLKQDISYSELRTMRESGMSVKEIALQLDVSVSTVYRYLGIVKDIQAPKMNKKKEIEKKNTPSTPIKAKSKKRTIKKVSKKKKKKTKK